MSKCGPKLIYHCNEYFFSEINEKSLYWAGFLAADGNVRKTSNKSRQLSLTLANKDRSHLERFKTDISSESPIRDVQNGNSKCGTIVITSAKIFDSLSNFNIVPAKTLIYEFPNWLLDHPLVNHFMRGYIDGDGCFRTRYRGKCRNLHVYISLRGTEKFLLDFKKVLEKSCELQNNVSITFDCKVGRVEYGGNNATSKITNFLYKDATVFLPRKYEIAKLSTNIEKGI